MTEPVEADVVVVGAGVLGLSAAWHLLEEGVGRVVVIDAVGPADGTSGAGAGFVGAWAAGYADFFDEQCLALEEYSLGFYRRLAELDPSIDLRGNGNLFVAVSEEGWTRWVETVATHRLAPTGTRALSAKEVDSASGGLLSSEFVVGGVLHPDGIQLSAGRAVRALARLVVSAGGELRTGTPVHGLLVDSGEIRGVRTREGDVQAPRVVLACGAWSNELLGPLGWELPLLRIVATRVISPPSSVSPSCPTVMVPELFGLWLREHRGGLTWGNGAGYAPLVDLETEMADEGRRPSAPQLVERLEAELVPTLRSLVPRHDTSIAHWVQGVPCMTPDRQFLVGPVPDVDGLFVLAGDNESGITHGPGLGRFAAELVAKGESGFVDGTKFRLERFASAHFADEHAVADAMPPRR